MKVSLNRKLINVMISILLSTLAFSCTGSGRSSGSRSLGGVSDQKNGSSSLVFETELNLAYNGENFASLLASLSTLFNKQFAEPVDMVDLVQCPSSISEQTVYDKYSAYNDLLAQGTSKYQKAISKVNTKSQDSKYSSQDVDILLNVAAFLFEEKSRVEEQREKCEASLASFNGGNGNSTPTPTPTFTPTPTPTPTAAAQIYAGTEKGLVFSTDGGKTFSLKSDAQGVTKGSSNTRRVNDIEVQGDMVYLATEKGVAISNNKAASFTTYSIGEGQFQDVFLKEGHLYGTSWRWGVHYLAPGSSSFVQINNSLPNNSISQMCEVKSQNDVYLIGTDNKLVYANISGSSFSGVTEINGTASNQIRGIFCDEEGVSYVTTTGGLSVVDLSGTLGANPIYANFNETSGLGARETSKVFATEDHIVVGTKKGVSVAKKADLSQSMKFTNYLLPAPASNNIKSVYVDSAGYVYAASWTISDSSNDGGGIYVSTEPITLNNPLVFKKIVVPFTYGYKFYTIHVVR